MNYALTINTDSIITGVHESLSEFTANTFANSPEYSNHTLILLGDNKGEYQQGVDLRCYDETWEPGAAGVYDNIWKEAV